VISWLAGQDASHQCMHLNELERDVSGEPFNWWDRLQHYTLDCQNPESIALVREIIGEVRPLFRSRYFNICADETFDLGKGKNKELAGKIGVGRLYMDFVKQIFRAVRKVDAIPMFWGDVIGHHPELVDEIPQNAIVLDWDYSAKLVSTKAGLMGKNGRAFYVCPGVSGWHHWLNDYRIAHRNITRLARHGKKHGASGLLNTDWGDSGHGNALGLSFPGLILGASAAWNAGSPALGEARFEEAVSCYEFGDASGQLLGLMRQVSMVSRAKWPTKWQMIATWQQPRPKDIPEKWYQAPREALEVILSTRLYAGDLQKIILLSRQIEKLLVKAAPLDSLVTDEIRTALIGVRLMEEIYLILQARAGRIKIRPPQAKAVVARLMSFEARLHREWLKRNKPSEYGRICEVLQGVAQDLLGRSVAAGHVGAGELDNNVRV